MKNLILIVTLALNLVINSNLFAKDYFYQIEENDQLGTIFLSLGHMKLWPKDGQVNLFKKKFGTKQPNRLFEGDILRIKEEDIIFKKNIKIEGKFLKIITKARNLEQYDSLLKLENIKIENKDEEISSPTISIIKAKPKVSKVLVKKSKDFTEAEITHSFNFYLGGGGFVANDSEKDRLTSSTTFSGLQPIIQFKGIYSNSAFGSLAVDLLAKKIVNDEFSFPVNTDYRFQFIPKWNFTNYFRFAFSHSMITHSYAGKSSDTNLAYKLNSNFFGIGVVIPNETFWLELFFESAYSGQTVSSGNKQEASNGIRFDSELVYPISKNWRLIPGVNYYQLKQNSTDYSLSVIEVRTVLSRSFDF